MTATEAIELPQIEDFRSFFLNDTPLLDVRAPIEFNQGAFPFTQNVPLMNDAEREAIGIQYKNLGQDEAIKLGHELVKDEIKSGRVNQWVQFFQQHPQGILYCFRGGMRSKISQQWIYEKTGIIYPRVKGGYKAMRRFLIDELETSVQNITPVILGGRTGIGKTLFLKNITQQIDLEGLFHHRGSVFGKHVTPQPSQIDIENALSIELLKLQNHGYKKIIFEDEGSNIGSRRIPDVLIKRMKQSPIVMLEKDIDERINITFQEYIVDALAEHQSFYGAETGFTRWAEQLQKSLDKIQRRLGDVRHKELKILLNSAIHKHMSGDKDFHKTWIKLLLVEYYDPMYDYQLGKSKERIEFKGNQSEVSDYLTQKYQISQKV